MSTEQENVKRVGEEEYSASNIQVLEGLEAVRKRPAMYIGDISAKGLHHLVYEVVDNSIDEALAGYCSHIEVFINEDNSITVQDNGRGIPVDWHEKEQRSALEVVMTVLHAGGKFDKGSYKVSGGLHGVGVSCVNALSTHMKTQVFRDGKIYQQEYSCGKPLYAVKTVGDADRTGTRQQFWPDRSIFTAHEYSYDVLANRMRELAFLNAGITITLTDLLDEVPVDAARWYFNAKPDTQMEFDLGLAVREDSENPIYYVEYAHARICSLLRAMAEEGLTVPAQSAVDMSLLKGETEQALIKQIAQFCEEIKLAARDYDPSHINRYLQELAACFHRFYGECRIKGETPEVMAARLKLADDTRVVLRNGLKLIGVDAPEKM